MAAILSLIHQTGDAIDEELYFPEDKDNPDQLEYADYVASAAKEFGVDEAIIYAIIYCESKFDPEVVSSVGARGLMQIMPATFEEIQEELGEKYDVDALFEPQINIRYGTYYLTALGYKVFHCKTLLHNRAYLSCGGGGNAFAFGKGNAL